MNEKGYLSVTGEAVTERVIEKSRFISYIAHTEGEEEARAFLEKIRSRHSDATHVCYAFIADKIGNLQRYSDDGEPQGTAGLPILGVLKAQKLMETTIAVVRYFGGIKLGAGGLTRAYAGGAADACERAEKCSFDLCSELLIEADYPLVDVCLRFFTAHGCRILDREFSSKALFTVAVRARDKDGILFGLSDETNGKVDILEGKRYLYPFPVT